MRTQAATDQDPNQRYNGGNQKETHQRKDREHQRNKRCTVRANANTKEEDGVNSTEQVLQLRVHSTPEANVTLKMLDFYANVLKGLVNARPTETCHLAFTNTKLALVMPTTPLNERPIVDSAHLGVTGPRHFAVEVKMCEPWRTLIFVECLGRASET